jgi:hypothetical protein
MSERAFAGWIHSQSPSLYIDSCEAIFFAESRVSFIPPAPPLNPFGP